MRISDWSSDVCSSDLHRAVVLEQEREHAVVHAVGVLLLQGERKRHAAVAVVAGLVPDPPRGQHVFPVRMAAGHRVAPHRNDVAAGLHQFEVEFGQVLERAVLVAGVAEAVDVLGESAAAGLARSEEHTSELQSLMRTSYAVFCLKK